MTGGTSLSNILVFLQRDCDSHLTKRDSIVVNAWLKTGSPFHCIRDHPSHARHAINAGMWGARRSEFRKLINYDSFQKMMRNIGRGYIDDTNFLNKEVWPKVKDAAYCHDSVSCRNYPRSYPFPVARGADYEHIGQVFDGKGKGRQGDIDILKRELTKWGVECLDLGLDL